ncbi:MAG: tetratricopeptide repeat protein [Coraliomargaritaceae bacterium]
MPLFRIAFSALLVVAGTSLSNAENPYWNQLANQPVFVEQDNNGRKQILKFTGYSDNMLQAELSLKNPDGSTSTAEISLPVSETMAQTLKFTLKNREKANQMIDQGNFAGALQLLRPDIYPLVRYNRLPEIFVDLHTPVRSLLNTLINAGEYAEAEDLFGRMELGKIGVNYSSSAVRLMNAYLIDEAPAGAARIAQMLSFDGDYNSNIEPVLLAADTIRSAGLYEAVIPLYRSIRPNATLEEQKRVDLWLAYSLVLADQMEEATLVIDSLEEPDPSEELFSLFKLLEGSRAYREGDYASALDTLTRGFVRAQTSYSWVPEMLYRIGDCYARAEDSVAARNVWSEITLLYPDSNWYQPASEAMNALPQPETLAE